LDASGKKELLATFAPILRNLNSSVDLLNPTHQLLYLEDWHGYHSLRNEVIAAAKGRGAPSSTVAELEYSSRQRVLGRIVAEGPNIQTLFALPTRPFLGTTVMSAVAAHLSAVAARVGPREVVLDPFCGTGGLLLAAAHLGAVRAIFLIQGKSTQ
jgi:hypothetical protein